MAIDSRWLYFEIPLGIVLIVSIDGMLGTAVRKKTVVSRMDLDPGGTGSGGTPPEHAGMMLDFVAPIIPSV